MQAALGGRKPASASGTADRAGGAALTVQPELTPSQRVDKRLAGVWVKVRTYLPACLSGSRQQRVQRARMGCAWRSHAACAMPCM